jgi:LPPG:FO 2-phospho-L-lactate transferase
MIVVLCGGVGAARFLEGLVQVIDPSEITAIVNTGDDLIWNTLQVCPDLDTVTYTLAGANATTGWGLEGETWSAIGALAHYGSPTWFGIGDKDLATHLFRSEALSRGVTLDEVTREITTSWGIKVKIIPMTNDHVHTKLMIESGEEIDFQEYFVHRQHNVAVASVRFDGIARSHPAPGVLEALEAAEGIIIAPSNPVVSIGPILAVPGINEVLERRRDCVAAISPIVGGKALKGPADRLLRELGHDSSAVGVARVVASICATMVIDELDSEEAEEIAGLGYSVVVTNTVMRDPTITVALARRTCEALNLKLSAGDIA